MPNCSNFKPRCFKMRFVGGEESMREGKAEAERVSAAERSGCCRPTHASRRSDPSAPSFLARVRGV